ncbi:MAG: S41 family peptidase, partial [Halanaerobiaceae bacterium]
MRKKILITLFILLISFSLPLIAVEDTGEVTSEEEAFTIFQEVLFYIENYHLEEKETDELIRGAVKGMVDSLDRFSEYMTEDEYEEMQLEFEGHFGGIGIVITPDLTIMSPIKGTPGERVGLQSGDEIIAIDGKSTEDMTQKEGVDLMRGDPGTSVTLTIKREGVEESLDFDIIREDIEIPYVEHEMKTDEIGYISIAQFVEGVGKKVEEAVVDLRQEGASALILDLRTNPGGLLTEAISVSSNFLDGGTVVSIKKRTGDDEVFPVDEDINSVDLPLLVLINQGTVSASEIVAGAVKDTERGVLMGKKTFCKGTVQS